MPDVRERRVVHCPDHEASHYLASFVAEHQVGDGSVRIALGLPISIVADRRIRIERRVIAKLYPLEWIGDPHPSYAVTWLPNGDGPAPKFAGALAVEQSPRDDCFGLILSGDYEPVSAMFDATHGRRIAHAAARNLLRSIANHVEKARAQNAAAHAGHSLLMLLTRRRASPSETLSNSTSL
jgi:hypothetical protein